MFSNNNFVRSRRRGSETILVQFVLLAGLLFASLVGVVAYMHFSSSNGNASTVVATTSQAGMVDVVVPIDNIEAGATLEPQMFRQEPRPEEIVGPEVVREFEEIKGLYSRGLLVANQPIHRDFLTNLQPVNALTASIPTGYRAIAIPVDAVGSVEGWAQPGARVDVIWVTNITGKKTASIIGPNAKVLSANRQTESAQNDDPRAKEQGEGIPKTVTLLLSNRDALKVRLASLNGRLALVLRGAVDPGTVGQNTTINEVNLQNGVNPTEPPPARNLTTVIVTDRKTGKRENLTFEGGQRVLDY